MGTGRLAGKRVLVTGAAGGQGQIVTTAFALEGASVFVTDLASDPLSAAQAEIQAVTGAQVPGQTADLRDATDVAHLVEEAITTLHGLDILYNNAAVRFAGEDGPVTTTDIAIWDATLAVNLRGMFLTCKYAIPHLLRNGHGGVVINVSSTAGLAGDPAAHAYSASKGGIIALTKSIAQTWGPVGLRANVICPGIIQTPMLEEALAHEAATRALTDATALRRIGLPGEVASCALFLASDEASYITGTVIEVHGGLAK